MTLKPLFTVNELYSPKELLHAIIVLDACRSKIEAGDENSKERLSYLTRRLADQSSNSGLQALLDWWMVCALGGSGTYAFSPVGLSSLGLDEELLDRLRNILGHNAAASEGPILNWIIQKRKYLKMESDLTQFINEIRNRTLHIDNEHSVREEFSNLVTEQLEALDKGNQLTKKIDSNLLDKIFKKADVKEGSNIHRTWKRTYEGIHKRLLGLEEIVSILNPFVITGIETDPIGNGRLQIADEDLKRSVEILLKSLLRDDVELPFSVQQVINDAVGEDEEVVNQNLLAVICQPLRDELEPFESLRVFNSIWEDKELKKSRGLDVSNVEFYLEGGLFDDARIELQKQFEEWTKKQQGFNLGKQLNRISEVIANNPFIEDQIPDSIREFGEIIDLHQEEIFEGLKDRIDDVEKKINTTLTKARYQEIEAVVEDICLLRSGDSAYIEAIKAEIVKLSTTQDLDELDREFDDYSNIRDAEIDLAFRLIDSAISKLRENPNEVEENQSSEEAIDISEISTRLSKITRDDPDVAALVGIRNDTQELEKKLQSASIKTWRAAQGEKELLEHIVKYVRERAGFKEIDIQRFYIALKSKRFVVLSGLTGTGKSTLGRLVAEALDATTKNGRFQRIAVRPNWVDQSEVLGFYNPLTNQFIHGWLTALIKRCQATPEAPHFCMLDEMNLAPVEQYLSEVLSAIEEEVTLRDDRPRLSLYTEGLSVENSNDWPANISLPSNLFFIGTVNIDESTRALTDRVVDRGHFIQLSTGIGDEHHSDSQDYFEKSWRIQISDWERTIDRKPNSKFHSLLLQIDEILLSMRIGLGVRTHLEIERFIANGGQLISEERALDLAILQRLIPKIRGYRQVITTELEELRELFEENDLRYSTSILKHWIESVDYGDDFIFGTDPFLGVVTSQVK